MNIINAKWYVQVSCSDFSKINVDDSTECILVLELDNNYEYKLNGCNYKLKCTIGTIQDTGEDLLNAVFSHAIKKNKPKTKTVLINYLKNIIVYLENSD